MSSATSAVSYRTVGSEPAPDRASVCRRTLVGPETHQPEPYEGYNGFVGWSGITRLRSGRWLLTFTSGLWHATLPWTAEIARDPACRAQFQEWHKIGLPDLPAPRGGRAHIMHSDDAGRSWSAPRTLVDTDRDDRHPTVVETADGTLFCSWFASRYPRIHHAYYMLSHDGGETWSAPQHPGGEPVVGSFGNGSAIALACGDLLWAMSGPFGDAQERSRVRLYRSTDNGTHFQALDTLAAEHSLDEPTIAELPDGRILLVARREGDMAWSADGGVSWSRSGAQGWGLFDPHLIVLPSGVLALFAGSYHGGGLRVLLSPDHGRTWHGPSTDAAKPYGYSVDAGVYGYSHPMLLEDGSIYVAYLHTGGHRPQDARTESLFGLRLRVAADASGIELLPAPGSPADLGEDVGSGTVGRVGDGGDPELGDRM